MPVMISSIPNDISIRPIIRVTTLMPVCPVFYSRGAEQQPAAEREYNAGQRQSEKFCQPCQRALQTTQELIAPAAISGSASGTTPILSRIAVPTAPVCSAYLPQLTADHGHGDEDNQCPRYRKDSMEIPNIMRILSPTRSDVHKITATEKFAIMLVLLRTAAV